MKTILNYTEAAAILGVHRESVANYVRRGLLTRSSTNTKAVTAESVQNLINRHQDVVDVTKEVEQMKIDLQNERDQLALLRQAVKGKIELNKAKSITHQNIGYICDALLVYLDAFGDNLTAREKQVVKAVFAHTDLSHVADDLGLTDNRVREIFQKALRRLAYHTRYDEIKRGYDELKGYVALKDEQIESLMARVEQLKHQLHIEEMVSNPESGYVSVPKEWMKTIKEIEISVRSCNCLRAGGVEYVYELAFLSTQKLMRWRNFGRKSLNEIDIIKAKFGMPDEPITDVTKFNEYRKNAERTAVPFAILENKRRELQ